MQPHLYPVPDHDATDRCPHTLALAEARDKIANLHIALTTARVISTAVGIIMATYKIRSDAAFDLLVVGSQNTHRKLRDLAHDVVDTGTLNWGHDMTARPHSSA